MKKESYTELGTNSSYVSWVQKHFPKRKQVTFPQCKSASVTKHKAAQVYSDCDKNVNEETLKYFFATALVINSPHPLPESN